MGSYLVRTFRVVLWHKGGVPGERARRPHRHQRRLGAAVHEADPLHIVHQARNFLRQLYLELGRHQGKDRLVDLFLDRAPN